MSGTSDDWVNHAPQPFAELPLYMRLGDLSHPEPGSDLQLEWKRYLPGWPRLRRAGQGFTVVPPRALARSGRSTLTPAAAPALTGTYPGKPAVPGRQTLETVKHHLEPNRQRSVGPRHAGLNRAGHDGLGPCSVVLLHRVREVTAGAEPSVIVRRVEANLISRDTAAFKPVTAPLEKPPPASPPTLLALAQTPLTAHPDPS